MILSLYLKLQTHHANSTIVIFLFMPSLDQILYAIFKKCPSLHAALLSLFQACWKICQVPISWKIGVIKLLPKSTTAKNRKNPANYRPIALTLCIGKLYTSVIKRRLETFMIGNVYINCDLQKAFVSGCHEHQFKVWSALQDAKSNQLSVHVLIGWT